MTTVALPADHTINACGKLPKHGSFLNLAHSSDNERDGKCCIETPLMDGFAKHEDDYVEQEHSGAPNESLSARTSEAISNTALPPTAANVGVPRPTRTPLRVKVALKNAKDVFSAKKETGCTSDSARAKTPASAEGSHTDTLSAVDIRSSTHTACRHSVLVAKCLTNSDASSGRIILPRVAVETNLPYVTAYRHYSLAVRCPLTGTRHEFVIKSWANGTEHRRVFVLEGAGEYLRSVGASVGDVVGICSDEEGELLVETNSAEVRLATQSPKYGSVVSVMPPPGSHSGIPLVLGASARCMRSGHCTKPAGHPGFCSGPKAMLPGGSFHARNSSKSKRALSRPAAKLSLTQHQGSDESSEDVAPFMVSPREVVAPGCEGTSFSSVGLPEGLFPLAHIPAGASLCKELTSYDLTSKRVVMPASDVEDIIAECRSVNELTLAAVDESSGWQFPTLRAWTAVSGRRGYLLEDLAAFLQHRNAEEGDVLVVYRLTGMSPPRVEVRMAPDTHPTKQGSFHVRTPSQADSSLSFHDLPLLLQPDRHAAAKQKRILMHREMVSSGMVCQRTGGCTKQAGHQGFCSGHKGFKRRDGMTSGGGILGHGHYRAHRSSHCPHQHHHESDYWSEEDDDDYTPTSKRMKRDSRMAMEASPDPEGLLGMLLSLAAQAEDE